MANRPSDLAQRMSDREEPGEELVRETLRLPVEAARSKALVRLSVSFVRAVT
jgi:hypothetical protein